MLDTSIAKVTVCASNARFQSAVAYSSDQHSHTYSIQNIYRTRTGYTDLSLSFKSTVTTAHSQSSQSVAILKSNRDSRDSRLIPMGPVCLHAISPIRSDMTSSSHTPPLQTNFDYLNR